MIIHGDSLIELKTIPDNSVDAVVTDSPYGLKFMGKKWDYDVPSVALWTEVLRVLKPGGHLLSFGGTRTYHRMVVAIEDAGFEIRDQINWIYGSGFPKSHNIKEGEFKGWGSALKPAVEPVVLARKPLEKGLTIAENVLKWGCGAINIDISRIAMTEEDRSAVQAKANKKETTNNIISGFGNNTATHGDWSMSKGRWPANAIFDEQAAALLDEQSGVLKSGDILPHHKSHESENNCMSGKNYARGPQTKLGDSGGASRFFYCAKSSKSERNRWLEGMPEKSSPKFDGGSFVRGENNNDAKDQKSRNFHPTVKPIKLMKYLIKLITPPNGIVLDPFMGSGTTGIACKQLGFDFIGIEREKEYCEIAEKRIEATC